MTNYHRMSINDYIKDNREICLKNYLLDILQNERDSINIKEKTVTNALKESQNKLELDKKNFIKFEDYQKEILKNNENVISSHIQINRGLTDKKKKLMQENRQVLDELDRLVKAILNLKGTALFVHSVIGGKYFLNKDYNNSELVNKRFKRTNSINVENKEVTNKDKELEKVTETLMYIVYFIFKRRVQIFRRN